MRNHLLRMITALICGLVVSAEITPVKDFNLGKMAGKWYMVGLGSNAEWFMTYKASMLMGTAILAPTAEEDLDLSYASLNNDTSCWRTTNLARRTDTPGRFTFHSQIWNNDNDMRIVEVVYDDYALVHTIKTKDGVSENFNELYSRRPEASEVMKQKFTQLCQETGITADNIVLLPKNDECPDL